MRTGQNRAAVWNGRLVGLARIHEIEAVHLRLARWVRRTSSSAMTRIRGVRCGSHAWWHQARNSWRTASGRAWSHPIPCAIGARIASDYGGRLMLALHGRSILGRATGSVITRCAARPGRVPVRVRRNATRSRFLATRRCRTQVLARRCGYGCRHRRSGRPACSGQTAANPARRVTSAPLPPAPSPPGGMPSTCASARQRPRAAPRSSRACACRPP